MKSGTVAVIGRANAGKSTLVNVLVGEKIAIVSPKPQTTRDRIMGICNRENAQIVFIDTPGLYRQFNALTDAMMKTTEDTAKEVDAIAYVLDAHAGMSEEDISLVLKYQGMGLPMLTVLTKIDIMPAKDVPAAVKTLADAGVQTDIYPVSARKGKNLHCRTWNMARKLKIMNTLTTTFWLRLVHPCWLRLTRATRVYCPCYSNRLIA